MDPLTVATFHKPERLRVIARIYFRPSSKYPCRVARKRTFASMTEMMDFFRETGRRGGEIGGKIAAKRMTKAQRVARAKKAAAASAIVRAKKARLRKTKV